MMLQQSTMYTLTIEKEEFIPSRVHTLQECSLSALLEGGLLHGICLRKTEECDIRSQYTHIYKEAIQIVQTLLCPSLNCISNLFCYFKKGQLWCSNLLTKNYLHKTY